MANKVGSITVEVKPTVTLESACACVMMLNLFLADNEGYRLEISQEDSRWPLTDEPFAPAMGGIYDGYLSALSNIPNPGSPSNMTEDERERIVKAIKETYKVKPERMV